MLSVDIEWSWFTDAERAHAEWSRARGRDTLLVLAKPDKLPGSAAEAANALLDLLVRRIEGGEPAGPRLMPVGLCPRASTLGWEGAGTVVS
ncbi:hypothetical protein [Nonomuraea endophytica]|uniref:hypothetical protein n=1 Tax=Nonomuraea endophytica TaxID=714136 RepID=UPI001615FE07|nr:hypothetical protein [Nonomuraea endophytica]